MWGRHSLRAEWRPLFAFFDLFTLLTRRVPVLTIPNASKLVQNPRRVLLFKKTALSAHFEKRKNTPILPSRLVEFCLLPSKLPIFATNQSFFRVADDENSAEKCGTIAEKIKILAAKNQISFEEK